MTEYPLKAIRLKCLDCCGSSKAVRFCTLDGIHSTKCPLWPFRFGKRPSTIRKTEPDMVDPHRMVEADVALEDCH